MKRSKADIAREKKFLMSRIKGDRVHCIHCGRKYLKDEMRYDEKTDLFMCPYSGCSGDAFLDAFDDIKFGADLVRLKMIKLEKKKKETRS
jgi:hypothetical protein